MKKKIMTLILMALASTCMCTGCGEKNNIEVSIKDGQVTTVVAVAPESTVLDALNGAEITVSKEDVVSADLSEKVTEGQKIEISRSGKVKVIEGDKEYDAEIKGNTVSDVLNSLGITVGENDYIDHELMAYTYNGMIINITHRFGVILSVDGEEVSYITKAHTVEDFLSEQGVALDEKDRISPAVDTVMEDGTRVEIERVSVKEVVEKEPIPFETVEETSASMYKDETEITTPGVDGEKEVTYQVTYVDGKEESRKAIDEKIITEPVSQVVVTGTKVKDGIVSRQAVYDCDGSGHGYYIITWSDGRVTYQDF